MRFFILGCLWLFGLPILAAQQSLCTGSYQGQMLNAVLLTPILKAHQVWLMQNRLAGSPGAANLCGVQMSGVNLVAPNFSYAVLSGSDLSTVNFSKANFSNATGIKSYFDHAQLLQSNFQNADFTQAIFTQAKLDKSSFQQATLQQANFRNASLIAADFRGANLSGVNFSDADLSQVNLSWANLKNADLSHANLTGAQLENADLTGANLTQANLTKADFKSANLTQANLTGSVIEAADFSKANLLQVTFQPALSGVPQLIAFASAKHFTTMRFTEQSGLAALIQMRAKYKTLGMRQMERALTGLVKTQQMHHAWQRGGWGYAEAILNYGLFYLPTKFGAAPSQALRLLLVFIILFMLPYWWALANPNSRRGILALWESRGEQQKQYHQLLGARFLLSQSSGFSRQWRLFKIALFFSVMSAFSMGWRELNVSHWILRLQKRACTLKGVGWVRVLAGSQAIVSAYLIVLWVLTYFGSPFEW